MSVDKERTGPDGKRGDRAESVGAKAMANDKATKRISKIDEGEALEEYAMHKAMTSEQV